jgi:antitoxin component YwqK of YwqJK toxin-antitoxin module
MRILEKYLMKTITIKWIVYFSFFIFNCSFISAQVTKDGYTKFSYPNGKISSEGTIRQGKPDGYWKNYYEDGKMKSEGNRKDFELDSTWKFYNFKGLMYLSYTYVQGKKTGYKTVYTPNPKDSSQGILISRENFIRDTLQGISYYYKDDKLHQVITYKDGLAEGKSFEFSPDSLITTITTYKGGFVKKVEKINRYNAQGRKEGLWQTFYASGNVKWEGSYEDGKREGYFKTYTDAGSLVTIDKYINDVLQNNAPELAKLEVKTQYFANGQVQESGPYKNGLPYGAHRIYNDSGVEQKAQIYDSGKVVAEGILDESSLQQGYWKEYHENGTLKSEGKYVYGVKVGEWKFYYMNGKKFEIGKYDQKGRPIGHWIWYYDDGKVLRESDFHEGLQDGDFVEYSDSGSVITQGQYLDGLKEGKWVYKNGNYKEVGKYTDDLQDSVWREYYVNTGKLRFIGAYNQGRPDGKHVWYYPSGRKELEGEYSMGLMEDKWKYYEELDGTIFLTITYKDDVELRYDQVKVEP